MNGVDSDEIFVAFTICGKNGRIFRDSSRVDFCFPSFPVKTVWIVVVDFKRGWGGGASSVYGFASWCCFA